MLEHLLTRTSVWAQPVNTKGNRVGKLEVPQHFKEQHFQCYYWGQAASGVPQGSILGPLLFVLYANKRTLPCSSEMFADDTLLYNSDSIDTVSAPVQRGLCQISDWCSSWTLKLNVDKCEFMRFTRSRTATAAVCSYNINSIPLKEVSSHKHLGVTIFNDLS